MRLTAKVLLLAAFAGAVIAAASPASAHRYELEYRFKGGHDGAGPGSSLIKVGGKLFGTSTDGGAGGLGTIFSFDPSTGVEATVYSFKGGADGSSPFDALIKVGGKLYGTTGSGGAGDCKGGCGTVFSFDPSTGVEAIVYAFQGQEDSEGPSALVYIDHTLYGTTFGDENGTAFSINLASGVEQTLHVFKGGADGRQPVGLTDMGGVLYGTTLYGGSSNCGGVGCGVVFSVNPATGHEKVVYAFKGGPDGALSSYGNSLIEVSGVLYGTTQGGGDADGSGTVFSVDPATGAETVLHAFQGGSDGIAPAGSLTAVGDTLYGVTFRGGGSSYGTCGSIGCGTVFSLNLTTGAEQVLHAFGGKAAGFPDAGLIYADHSLFGTTAYGGRLANCYQGCGTVFEVKP
jgi:uncharacterized repeat protein (TIGR03803 family)